MKNLDNLYFRFCAYMRILLNKSADFIKHKILLERDDNADGDI